MFFSCIIIIIIKINDYNYYNYYNNNKRIILRMQLKKTKEKT